MRYATGFPARLAPLAILSLLAASAASAAGLSPAAYSAAFDSADSDAPAYVQVTITPETGPDWTGCVSTNFLIGAIAKQIDATLSKETLPKLIETARQSDHFHFSPAALAGLPRYSEADRMAARTWASSQTNDQWLEIGRRGPVNIRPLGEGLQLPYEAMACAFIERGISVETWDGRGGNLLRIGWHRKP